MRLFKILLFIVALEASATLPPPSTVETLSKQSAEEEVITDVITEQFSQLYRGEKQPRITILWNRKYDDQLSDWEGPRSQHIVTENIGVNTGEKNVSIDFQSKSGTMSRKLSTIRLAPDEVDIEAFKTGFSNVFLTADTKLVSRDSILRLAANERDKANNYSEINSKQLETSAFLSMTDLILELLFVPSPESSLGFDASVSVKDVKSGQLIVRVKSEIPEPTHLRSWQPSESGFKLTYEKQKPPTFTSLGHELAIATMTHLIETWKKTD